MTLDDYIMEDNSLLGTATDAIKKPIEMFTSTCDLVTANNKSISEDIEKTSDLKIKKKQAKLAAQLSYSLNGLEKLGYNLDFETNKLSKIKQRTKTSA